MKENNVLYSDIIIDLDNAQNDLLSLSDNESDRELENLETLEEEENPLNLHRFNFQETVFVPTIISEEEVSIAPGEGKQPMSILSDKFCEELAFPHLFPRGRFGYKVDRQIKLSPAKYFNQRFLNYTVICFRSGLYIFCIISYTAIKTAKSDQYSYEKVLW